MKFYRCDHCRRDVNSRNHNSLRVIHLDADVEQDYDLCEDCYVFLEDWFKGKN